jgi:hypothetical protein
MSAFGVLTVSEGEVVEVGCESLRVEARTARPAAFSTGIGSRTPLSPLAAGDDAPLPVSAAATLLLAALILLTSLIRSLTPGAGATVRSSASSFKGVKAGCTKSGAGAKVASTAALGFRVATGVTGDGWRAKGRFADEKNERFGFRSGSAGASGVGASADKLRLDGGIVYQDPKLQSLGPEELTEGYRSRRANPPSS